MKQLKTLFSRMDQALFEAMDNIKTTTAYSKLTEALAGLTEESRKVVNQVMLIILILLPLGIFGLLYRSNLLQKEKIAQQKRIYALTDGLIKAKASLAQGSGLSLSQSPPQDQTRLNQLLGNLLAANQISPAKASVTAFKTQELSETTLRVDASLTVQDLALKNFTGLVEDLHQRLRFNISALDLTRNDKNKTLQGTIDMVLIGQKAK